MRPAVHASNILRHRHPRRNPRRNLQNFSAKRLLIMVSVGFFLLIPGMILFIIGMEKSTGDMDDTVNVIYQVVAPAISCVGAVILFASCIYFYCYGTGHNPSIPSHGSQNPEAPDGDQEDKGSIRSSGRNKSHYHHHHHHHHHHNKEVNGRSPGQDTPDSECRISLRMSDGNASGAAGNNKEGQPSTAEDQVPLAKIEDSSDLSAKGLKLTVPTVLVHGPSDISDSGSESSRMDSEYSDDKVNLTFAY